MTFPAKFGTRIYSHFWTRKPATNTLSPGSNASHDINYPKKWPGSSLYPRHILEFAWRFWTGGRSHLCRPTIQKRHAISMVASAWDTGLSVQFSMRHRGELARTFFFFRRIVRASPWGGRMVGEGSRRTGRAFERYGTKSGRGSSRGWSPGRVAATEE